MIITLKPGPDGKIAAQQQDPTSSQSLFTGFMNSALSAIPETFGADPGAVTFSGTPQDVVNFRRDHPWLGFGSEVAGMAIPYTGWFKAAKGLEFVGKGAKAAEAFVGGAKASPILASAARAVAVDAPFEAGRVAVSSAFGDNTGQVATSAATNLAMVGAFGAGGGVLRAIGKVKEPLPELPKAVNMQDPITLQLRSLLKTKQSGEATSPDAVDFWINRYTDAVRREQPLVHSLDNGKVKIEQTDFVAPLEGNPDVGRLNRLFKAKENSPTIAAKRLIPEAWVTDDVFQQALSKSGIVGKEDSVQFPRLVTAKGKGISHAADTITSTLTQVAPDTWMAREANDGLYVMAKRVDSTAPVRGTKGKPGIPAAEQWMLFKTDMPGRFAPLGDAWTASLENVAKWAKDPTAPIGTPMNDALQALIQKYPLYNYNDTMTTGKLGQFLQTVRKETGLDRLNGGAKEAARQSYAFAKEHVAPAMFQFKSSPRAAYIFNNARNLYHYAEATAKTILEGETTSGKSLFHHVLNGPNSSGKVSNLPAVNPLIDSLTTADRGQVWLAHAQMWEPKRVKEAVISGEISPEAGKAINVLNALDMEQFGNLTKTQKAYGMQVSKPQPGHLMISNTWSGSIRVPVLDADGKLVILASGRNRGEALAEADKIIEGGTAQGFKWKQGDSFHEEPGIALEQLLQGATQNKVDLGSRQFQVANALRVAGQRARMRPSTLRERSGVGGYIGQYAPWTKQELKDIISSRVLSYQRYQARLNIENAMAPDLLKLMQENPSMYQQIMARMQDLAGIPSPSAQIINRIADKTPLGAVLGKNSASKSVAVVNSITHHLQLGLGNITFPVINALQPLTTTIPQLAFVLRATESDLAAAGYRSWNLVGDAAGRPKESAGVFNVAKMLGQSFKEMHKPSEILQEHISRAAREGQWSHTFNQEVIGPEALVGQKLRNALEGKHGVIGMLEQWSNMLPNMSERFSRVQSFTLGHMVGRDLRKLEGDELYHFAKRFTENSNFAYGTADRARVITGPMGSFFGLYKNWQMHYAGWMLNYIGQGVNKGNWAPLLYQAAGTTATGGIGSLAGYGVADEISKLLTDKDLMQHVYDNFGSTGSDTQMLSDAVYFGLPSFLGITLQNQASEPGANPVRDAAMMFSVVQLNRMRALGTAIGNGWDTWETTGQNPLTSPLVRANVTQVLAPKSLFHAMQLTNDGLIRSLRTGNPTARVGMGSRVLFAMGLSPVDVEKQLVVSDKLWRDKNAMRNAVQAYGRSLAEASGDPDVMRMIMLRAMADGVPIDSIVKSSITRRSHMRQDVLERQFKGLKVKEYQNVLGPGR